MKPDWTEVALGDVATVVSGATPKTSEPEFWGGEIPWVTPKDLSDLDGGKYLAGTPRTLTAEGLKSCAASMLPAGSVLLSSRAPIGLVAINQMPVATNQGFKSLVPRATLDPSYLYWWLRTHRRTLESLGRGATFKEVSKAIVEEVEIPLPPLEEQRRIAAILDKADELLAKRRAAIAHLDSLTQAIFLDMFGDPGFSGWTLTEVGEIAEVQGGLQVSRKRKDLPVEVPFMRVANVHRGRLDLSEVKTMRATAAEISRTTLQSDDLLVVEGHGNADEIGRVARWTAEISPCVHQNHLIRVRVDPSAACGAFVEMALNTGEGLRQLRAAGRTTSGLNTLSTNDVRRISIHVPPVALQNDFAERAARVSEARSGLAAASREAGSLVASLQSRAFRGEL